ncbi:MAG: radical protein [Bacteroidetes bacterium]|nr:radical protein [Bacteroidota bacterium]
MILLTHGYFLCEDQKEQAVMKPYVPLGILYISAFLDEKNIENEVYDSTFSTFENLKNHILNSPPVLIGIYTNLMTKINVLKIISFLKTNALTTQVKIILGGPELRHYTKEYLEHGADLLIIGEGEDTMAEVCSFYNKNKFLPQHCAGTALIHDNTLIVNAERTLIKDINTLPFPNRKKVDLSLYLNTWKKHHGKSVVSVSTMRGCPYTCKWCSRAIYGGSYRRRSPLKVVEELLSLKEEYNPDAIWFVDDVFTISHKWLKEFAELIIKKNGVIPYEIITRADRMNEEVIRLLKQSGCFRVWIGAESGSQNIIDAMDRRVDVTQVKEMILLTKKYGIETGTFIMLGYPGETKKDIRQTINHLRNSNPDFYTITLAYPIKGTPLYTEVEKSITANISFSTMTDRDLDFIRTHSTRYYRHALRWVHNSVEFKKEANLFKKSIFMLKSALSQLLMSAIK